MTHEEAIKAIQTEIECVKRQGKTGECCRDELGCGACDLVFEDEWILEAYGMAIHALEAENNGDITAKEALYATARLVDRVLEILPNMMQSVIDAMPDEIEKYLKEKNKDQKTILHDIGSDGEKILDLCQFEWGHQKDKPLTRFYVNHCGGEEEMIEMQLEDTSFESNESVDYEHVTDRNGHSYNIIKGFRKSITLTFSGYMPNNGYGWECDEHEIN